MALFMIALDFWKLSKPRRIPRITTHHSRVRIADAGWQPAFGITMVANPAPRRVATVMGLSVCRPVLWTLAGRVHPLRCSWRKVWVSLLNRFGLLLRIPIRLAIPKARMEAVRLLQPAGPHMKSVNC